MEGGFGNDGDAGGVELTTTLYGELHRLAAARMSLEYNPQTIQATALIHEAWLRLGGDKQPEWVNRAHFISAAARTMRRILIDRARRRQAIRHGGGQRRVELDAWDWEKLDQETSQRCDKLLISLERALGALNKVDSSLAELVELQYFSRATVKEIAEFLDMSERSVRRRLAYARAWLEMEIEEELETF